MAIVLPHKFKDGVGEAASGVQVLENDETLKVAIEAAEATLAEGKAPVKVNGSVITNPELKTFQTNPTCGPGGGAFPYTEFGISFPTLCLAAWIGGWIAYTDVGKASPTWAQFNASVVPEGKNVKVVFSNQSGVNLFPAIYLLALGH